MQLQQIVTVEMRGLAGDRHQCVADHVHPDGLARKQLVKAGVVQFIHVQRVDALEYESLEGVGKSQKKTK